MIQIHNNLAAIPAFTNAVITIGTYDGVHIGHRVILEQLRIEAAKCNGESVIISFSPHPRKVISSVPGDIRLLTTMDEKIDLLNQLDIHHLIIVPFDDVFANMEPEDFVINFLYKKFNPHTLIMGYDHRFGKNRKGNFELLQTMSNALGFVVKKISEQLINDAVISSTNIRKALLAGDIVYANQLLGYAYSFEGKIIAGNQLGRTIGFPTANLHIESDEKLIPSNGVYAASCIIEGDNTRHKGMMNIGVRPTIDGKKRMIEINIFDFDREIYGKKMKIFVHQFIRNEKKFDGLDALKEQIQKDKLTVLGLNNFA